MPYSHRPYDSVAQHQVIGSGGFGSCSSSVAVGDGCGGSLLSSNRQGCFVVRELQSRLVVVSCCHWDLSIRITWIDSFKPPPQQQAIFKHQAVVTCLTLTDDAGPTNFLVSGSKDSTIIVWTWNEKLPLESAPKLILYGHNDEVTHPLWPQS